MKFEKVFNPSDASVKELRDLLVTFNLPRFETDKIEEFAIFIKDDEKQLIGGISGEIFGQWLNIDYLVIDENYRNQQLGIKLLTQVEDLAREKNCSHVFLTTFGFQGKDYYPKFGYEEIFVRKNYPITGTEHFFTKNLCIDKHK